MSKFYQRLSQNPETSIFHHGLICTLVEFYITSTWDNWEKILVRNQFLPQHNDPIIDLTQATEESISPRNFHQEVHIEIQLHDDPIISLDGQVYVIRIARMALKRKGFVP
jgi:hypothetical protein